MSADTFAQAHAAITPALIEHLFPGGEWRQGEYWTCSPLRADESPGSFSINEQGLYNDFVPGGGAGDFLDLVSRARGITLAEAAEFIVKAGGNGHDKTVQTPAKKKEKPAPVIPYPIEARDKFKHCAKSKYIVEKIGPPVDAWEYRYQNGQPWAIVARHEKDGKKSTPPYSYCEDGKFHQGAPLKKDRPLYNIDKVKEGCRILVVEGERCASVEVPGYVSISWMGGSAAVRLSDWKSLEGRAVIIWPDADASGLAAAHEIAGLLPSVEILDIQGKPKGWDIYDAVKEGIDPIEFIKTCPRVKPAQEQKPRLRVYTAADLLTMDFPEERWLVPGIIPEGVSMLASPPKTGKSFLFLDLATTISIGGVCMSQKVDQAPTLLLALEDNPRRIKSRIQRLSSLDPMPLDPRLCSITCEWPTDGERFTELYRFLDDNPDVKVVFIDTFGRFTLSQDNNDYSEQTRILTGIKNFAEETGVSILLAHHTRKNHEGEDFLNQSVGSIAIAGGVDNVLILTRKRGQADGVLKVTGRDVQEQELAVHFDNQSCRWAVLGKASDFAESAERREIVNVLKNADGALGPKDVAGILKKNISAVKFLLSKMVSDGQIQRINRGEYIPLSTNDTNLTSYPNYTNPANHTNQDDQGEIKWE